MTFRVQNTLIIDNSRNVIIGSGSSRPASPAAGTIWFNTSNGLLEGWNGTSWVALSS